MIKLTPHGVYLLQGEKVIPADEYTSTVSSPLSPDMAREHTLSLIHIFGLCLRKKLIVFQNTAENSKSRR